MKKINIGVLISGGGTNLQTLIDHCNSGNINGIVRVVISNKKNAFGLQRAANHDIPPVFISKKEAGSEVAFNRQIAVELEKHNVDLVVLAGYLNILTPEFINAYRNRIINIHPALLPSFGGKGFYGEKVHQAVIDFGAKITGATVHFVDEGTDTGAIIMQKAVEVADTDTAETLQKRVLQIEHQILPQSVKLFCENKLQIVDRVGKRPLVVVD